MTHWRISILSFAAAAALVFGACGSSHKASTSTTTAPAATTPTTATGGAGSSAFCTEFSKFESSVTSAAGDTQLAQAKRDYQNVVTQAEAVTDAPASLKSSVAAAVNDLKTINTWVQSSATQADLAGKNVPAAISGPFNDLQTQGTTIVNYAKSHCG